MGEPSLIKVCLTNKGEDTETPWAHDLGPAGGADGARKVRLVNVPFMHAKPTWGDTIVVRPHREAEFPTWDREGVPWKQIASKIVEDGGRWAMIIDYAPRIAADEAFAALGRACDEARIVCEGAWGPRDAEPGRVYLAVQKELNADQVMGILVGASLPMDLYQIHPEPKKRPRAQTVTGISEVAGRPPAASPKPGRAKTAPPVVAGKKPNESSSKPTAKPAPAQRATPSPARAGGKGSSPVKAPAKPAAKAVKPPAKAAKAAAKPAARAARKQTTKKR